MSEVSDRCRIHAAPHLDMYSPSLPSLAGTQNAAPGSRDSSSPSGERGAHCTDTGVGQLYLTSLQGLHRKQDTSIICNSDSYFTFYVIRPATMRMSFYTTIPQRPLWRPYCHHRQDA